MLKYFSMRGLLLLLISLCLVGITYGQEKKEIIKIPWPPEYKWKIGSDQEDQNIRIIELIPENESIEKWTIIATVVLVKGARNVPIESAMNLTFDQAKANAPKAKLTLFEKDEKSVHPWILFKIESPNFKDDKNPESQLYYIIQGDENLYSNLVAMKEKTLSQEFVEKWSGIFKASQLILE